MRRLEVSLTLALSLSFSSAALATPSEVGKALARAARRKRPCKGFYARYSAGRGFRGYTQVTIRGTRLKVLRTLRRNRSRRVYRSHVAASVCRTLLTTAQLGKLWAVTPRVKRGARDESRSTIAVGVRKHIAHVRLWASEGRDIKVFARLRQLMLALAARASRGRVTY